MKRIVAISDTHLFHDELGELPRGDVLVHAGDMLRFGDLVELDGFVEWFLAQPHPVKIVIAGNHDCCFETDRRHAEARLGTSVIYLQDSGCELFGLKWWGSPWQPAYREWAFNLERGDPLRQKWDLIPGDTDILITHAPPEGTGDRSPMDGRQGCTALRERVAELRPLLHLFGHIHQDGGFWSDGQIASANVTTWECDRAPTVIDVDPEERLVRPIGIPGPGI